MGAAMALFGKNDYGKNLTNATLWLEASEADNEYEHSSSGDSSGVGCGLLLAFFALLALLPAALITCVAYAV